MSTNQTMYTNTNKFFLFFVFIFILFLYFLLFFKIRTVTRGGRVFLHFFLYTNEARKEKLAISKCFYEAVPLWTESCTCLKRKIGKRVYYNRCSLLASGLFLLQRLPRMARRFDLLLSRWPRMADSFTVQRSGLPQRIKEFFCSL